MKALPLHQPWASLVALGAKRVETRHWSAPPWLVGQRIAIHANRATGELWRCREDPFDEYVPAAAGLPLGALLCTVVVKRCAPITAAGAEALERESPHEFAFGNYDTTGRQRYAWVLTDLEPFDVPVPWKGSQGIFDVPDERVGHDPPQGTLL